MTDRLAVAGRPSITLSRQRRPCGEAGRVTPIHRRASDAAPHVLVLLCIYSYAAPYVLLCHSIPCAPMQHPALIPLYAPLAFPSLSYHRAQLPPLLPRLFVPPGPSKELIRGRRVSLCFCGSLPTPILWELPPPICLPPPLRLSLTRLCGSAEQEPFAYVPRFKVRESASPILLLPSLDICRPLSASRLWSLSLCFDICTDSF